MVASEMDKFETPRTNRAVVADQCTSPGDAIRLDGRRTTVVGNYRGR